MKPFVLTLMAYASVGVAQLLNVPACAQTCFSSANPSCGPADIRCLCSTVNFRDQLTGCYLNACSEADARSFASDFNGICAEAGITYTLAFASSTAAGGSSRFPGTTATATGAIISSTGTTQGQSTGAPYPSPASLSIGAIAGIAVGAVAGVVLLATAAFLVWRRRRSTKNDNPPPVEAIHEGGTDKEMRQGAGS
ncbi:hypothetical protein BKA63DRAFT_487223 [Paraphoma chrysanthemicola]|nr:hypothetical protein BKA63DRAFT_487223 [Paraphoma chrysanthemicola]